MAAERSRAARAFSPRINSGIATFSTR
jgi:hypothetical protein